MNTIEIKAGYESYTIDQAFTSKKLFFLFYSPIPKSAYDVFKKEYAASGKSIDWSVGMIEEPQLFGMSWMGLPDASGDKKIQGEFVAFKMVGDYSQFKTVWTKIMKDYPKLKEGYHIYKTDPSVTKTEDNVTYIIFR
jgi:hypothetical protein